MEKSVVIINQTHTFGMQQSSINYLNDKVERIQNQKVRRITRFALLLLKAATLPLTLTIDFVVASGQGIIACSKGLGGRQAWLIFRNKICDNLRESKEALAVVALGLIIYGLVVVAKKLNAYPVLELLSKFFKSIEINALLKGFHPLDAKVLSVLAGIGGCIAAGIGFGIIGAITAVFLKVITPAVFAEGANRNRLFPESHPTYTITSSVPLSNFAVKGKRILTEEDRKDIRTVSANPDHLHRSEEKKQFLEGWKRVRVLQEKINENLKDQETQIASRSGIQSLFSTKTLGYSTQSTAATGTLKVIEPEAQAELRRTIQSDVEPFSVPLRGYWDKLDSLRQHMKNPPEEKSPADPYERLRKLIYDDYCSAEQIITAAEEVNLDAHAKELDRYPDAEMLLNFVNYCKMGKYRQRVDQVKSRMSNLPSRFARTNSPYDKLRLFVAHETCTVNELLVAAEGVKLEELAEQPEQYPDAERLLDLVTFAKRVSQIGFGATVSTL